MSLEVKVAETLEDVESAYAIRRRVFVEEQKVPVEIERDEQDRTAVHVLALLDGSLVGTGRILLYEEEAKIGRVAVLPEARGRGAGTAVTMKLVELAAEKGIQKIVLNAQLPVVPFYSRLGFQPEGTPFREAGIPHRRMCLSLGSESET